jgi:hypothetical protein
MILKIIAATLFGALLGGVAGYFLQCAGGSCPLTCNRWGGAIVGALIAVVFIVK